MTFYILAVTDQNLSIDSRVLISACQESLLFSHFLTKGLFSSDTEFVDGLKYRFHRVKRAEENIEDVYDGFPLPKQEWSRWISFRTI